MKKFTEVGTKVVDIVMLAIGEITSLDFKNEMRHKGFTVSQSEASDFLFKYFANRPNTSITYVDNHKVYSNVDGSDDVRPCCDKAEDTTAEALIDRLKSHSDFLDKFLNGEPYSDTSEEEMSVDEESVIHGITNVEYRNEDGVTSIVVSLDECDCDASEPHKVETPKVQSKVEAPPVQSSESDITDGVFDLMLEMAGPEYMRNHAKAMNDFLDSKGV